MKTKAKKHYNKTDEAYVADALLLTFAALLCREDWEELSDQEKMQFLRVRFVHYIDLLRRLS